MLQLATTVPRGESAATARRWQIATRFLAPPTQGRPPDGRLQKEDTTMRHSTVGKLVTGAALLAVVVGLRVTAAPPEAQALSRPIGDIQVFATLGYPGHPGGLAVNGRTLYVSTSNAGFDRLFDTSDEIWAFRLDTGGPVQTGTNPMLGPRQASAPTMRLFGLALDGRGLHYISRMNGRRARCAPC